MSPAQSRSTGSLANILRNTGWMLGGKGVGAVLSLIYLAILTRSLGIEGFGTFALALGAGQGVASFVAFQSWQIVVRYGMPHLHAGRRGEVTRLIRFTTLLDIIGAIIGATLVAIVMPLLGGHFGWSPAFTQQALAICIVLVLATHWTPVGILRLSDRFATATLADAVTPIVRCLGAVAIWLTAPSVIGFLAVWALAEVLTAAAYWTFAMRVKTVPWRMGGSLRWRDVAAANPGIASYAATTNLTASLDLGGRQLAVLLVGLLVTPAAAGGFRLAQQLAQALAKLSQMMARAIFPELMRSRADEGESKNFHRLFKKTARLTAVGGAIVFLVLLLLGRPALGLIAGPEFVSAYPVLLLLGTAAALDFAAVGFEPALVALGRPGLALKLRFVSTSALLLLMLTLPRHFGATGAGAAVLVASALSMLLLWTALKRLVRR
jgi:O-antigen/teichoic acid export membrane protein